MNDSTITETITSISSAFELPIASPFEGGQGDEGRDLFRLDSDAFLRQIKEQLSIRIKFLIANDLEKLLHIIYRIDIPESQVSQIFEYNAADKIPDSLSDFIINRQLSKVKTREHYKSAVK